MSRPRLLPPLVERRPLLPKPKTHRLIPIRTFIPSPHGLRFDAIVTPAAPRFGRGGGWGDSSRGRRAFPVAPPPRFLSPPSFTANTHKHLQNTAPQRDLLQSPYPDLPWVGRSAVPDLISSVRFSAAGRRGFSNPALPGFGAQGGTPTHLSLFVFVLCARAHGQGSRSIALTTRIQDLFLLPAKKHRRLGRRSRRRLLPARGRARARVELLSSSAPSRASVTISHIDRRISHRMFTAGPLTYLHITALPAACPRPARPPRSRPGRRRARTRCAAAARAVLSPAPCW